MGAVTAVADPIFTCAGELRGLPGPRSAAVLSAWTYQPGEPPDSPLGPLDEVVEVVAAAQRLAGWAVWCQLAAAARLLLAWRRQSPLGSEAHEGCDEIDRALAQRLDRIAEREQRSVRTRRLDPEELAPDFVSMELALACGLTRSAATHRVLVAQSLIVDRRHPRTAVLARAGLVEWGKLHLLITRLGGLEPLVAELVERRVIPDADLATAGGTVNPRRSRRRPGADLPFVTRCTLPQLRAALDAAIAAIDPDRADERAERARDERSVVAENEADGVARLTARGPAEAVAAIMNDLDVAAAAAKAAGDARTCDQIRTDEAFYRLSRGAYGAPATSQDAVGGASAEHGHGSRPRTQVSLTMPFATWLGLASQPGQLEGFGTVAAALARQIAADAARNDPATTTWRCVVTDDDHGTVVGIGRPIVTPEHDAPVRVAALVRAAEGTCVFPGCSTPARRCDLDHRRPFPVGATCSCNLQPLCRGHHRLKTTGHLTVRLVQPGEDENVPPGTLEWTTKAGRIYRSLPSQPVPSALEPALAGIPARLAELRKISSAQVRRLNANIYAAYARRIAGQLDEAWDPAGVPDDTDETIERPPATIDDDPAPSEPGRPLELWDPGWDGTWDQASDPAWDPACDQGSDPAWDSACDQGSDPAWDPACDRGSDPAWDQAARHPFRDGAPGRPGGNRLTDRLSA
jgi:hypothetical protein